MQTTYFTAALAALPEECAISISIQSKGVAIGSVTKLKLKRRFPGGIYATIWEKPITSTGDFTVELKDYGTKALYEYEYAIVPCAGNTELTAATDSIKCVFDGIIIADLTASYVTFLNASYSPGEHHNPVNKVETLGRKYPFIVRNGAADYLSGSVTGIFAPQIGNLLVSQDAWRESAVRQYKNEFIAFLKNGLCKTLKTYDGQMWYVSIDTNPKENITAHWWASEITFEWTEVGAPPERVVVV